MYDHNNDYGVNICTIDDYRVAEVYNRASQCLSLCLSIPALYTLTRVRMIIFVDDDDAVR